MHRRSSIVSLFFLLVLLLSFAQLGCGGFVPISAVAPSSATVTAGTTQQFSVSQQLFGGTQWLVNGVPGGNATFGTISQTGLYNAPETATEGEITVTAQGAGAPGQQTSATIQLVNPVPHVQSFTPAAFTAESGPIAITITGMGLTPATMVSVGSTKLASTYVSGTQVRAELPPDLTGSGGVSITVANPQPGGGNSQPLTLPILSPASVTLIAGSSEKFELAPLAGGTTWSVNGIQGGTANIGTIDVTGLYTAPSEAPSSPVTITASSAAPAALSVSATIEVLNPVPVLTGVNPSEVVSDGSSITVTLAGNNFVKSSQVLAGKIACATTFISASELQATLPSSGLEALTVIPIVVQTNTPGGGSSAPQNIQLASRGTVTATAHPLVARYDINAPPGSSVRVDFGPDQTYGRSTWTRPAPDAGGNVSILVAGMKADSSYHIRARVNFADGGTQFDADHVFATGSLPPAGFPTVNTFGATGAPVSGGGINLLSITGGTSLGSGNSGVSAVALDMDGSPIWYYWDPTSPSAIAFPVKQLSNGDFLLIYYYGAAIIESTLDGTAVRSISVDQLNAALAAAGSSLQISQFHHDILELPNGHWIVLANEFKDYQDLPGYPGVTTVQGDALIDLDANNNPIWTWRTFDHLDVNRQPYGFPDWTHSNAVVSSPDGNLMLSMRHQNWVIKINYANGTGNGDILWRLGPGGDFNLNSSDPAQWFYDEHYPNLLSSNGSKFRLALFDNGNMRPDSSSGQPCLYVQTCYSRGVILDVDESALTASLEWEDTLSWFGPWGGNIDLLANGNIVMDTSSVGYSGGFSKVIEVTPDVVPQIVWEMDASDSYFYRANRIPSLYPGVQW